MSPSRPHGYREEPPTGEPAAVRPGPPDSPGQGRSGTGEQGMLARRRASSQGEGSPFLRNRCDGGLEAQGKNSPRLGIK